MRDNCAGFNFDYIMAAVMRAGAHLRAYACAKKSKYILPCEILSIPLQNHSRGQKLCSKMFKIWCLDMLKMRVFFIKVSPNLPPMLVTY